MTLLRTGASWKYEKQGERLVLENSFESGSIENLPHVRDCKRCKQCVAQDSADESIQRCKVSRNPGTLYVVVGECLKFTLVWDSVE